MFKNLKEIYNKLLLMKIINIELLNNNNKRNIINFKLEDYIIEFKILKYNNSILVNNYVLNNTINDACIFIKNKININDSILIKFNNKMNKYTYIKNIKFFDNNKYEYDYNNINMINDIY